MRHQIVVCNYPQKLVDLSGPQGNAFFIIAAVRRILHQIGGPKEEVDEYINQIQSSDYANLLQVSKDTLDKHDIEYDFSDSNIENRRIS